MSADTEKLHFKIGVSGTYWAKKPKYSILVNDDSIVTQEIQGAENEIEYFEFDREVTEGPVTLTIRLENKESSDTVKDDEILDEFVIVKDMLLNIESIEIDDIDIGNLIYSAKFVGDDPSRPVLDKCRNMGWNGNWNFEFNSPFYIWLLENI